MVIRREGRYWVQWFAGGYFCLGTAFLDDSLSLNLLQQSLSVV